MSNILKKLYLILIYTFLYFPLLIVVVLSFNSARFSSLWHGFTMQWYQQLIQDHQLITTAGHSILLATLASSIAAFAGTVAATCLFRYRFFGKSVFNAAIFGLILIPDIVLAVALLLLYKLLHLPLGFTSLLLAHITFCTPFAILIIYARMQGLDKHSFEAAKDLGARDSTIFYKIIIPLMWPAIIAAWLLSFTLSMDDVVVSYFVSGPSYQILPLWIFAAIKGGVSPEINALCAIMLVLTFVIVISAQKIMGKKS